MNKDEQLRFVHNALDAVKTKTSGYILINRISEDWGPAELLKFMQDEVNFLRIPGQETKIWKP